MLFTTIDEIDWDISMAFLCDFESIEETDTSATISCSTSPGGRVFFGNFYGTPYDNPEDADEIWQKSNSEVAFDGQALNLPAFGYMEVELYDTADTPYGTLAGIVCWDADFPMTVRQAGKKEADILFVANGDNEGHFREHAQMSIFRAVENGVSLVRQDVQGFSLVTDPYGRILAMVDIGNSTDPVMSAQVPTQSVFTIYPIIGDLFGWLSVVGFVSLESGLSFMDAKQRIQNPNRYL